MSFQVKQYIHQEDALPMGDYWNHFTKISSIYWLKVKCPNYVKTETRHINGQNPEYIKSDILWCGLQDVSINVLVCDGWPGNVWDLNKLKSLKVAKWRKDEWRMTKDDDFKLLRGFADWQTNRQTDEWTYVNVHRWKHRFEILYRHRQ